MQMDGGEGGGVRYNPKQKDGDSCSYMGHETYQLSRDLYNGTKRGDRLR